MAPSCAASGTGAISESVDVPVGGTATFSVIVAIDPSATGTITNTADIAAPTGVTDADSGNDSASDTDTLEPSADIVVTNSDGVTSVTAGTSTTYTVTVSNVGPSDAPGTAVSFPVPAGGTITGWSCADDGTSTCGDGSGSGAIATSVDLPSGTSVTYTVTVDVDQSATGTIDATATATPAVGITDPTPANNSATDTDTVDVGGRPVDHQDRRRHHLDPGPADQLLDRRQQRRSVRSGRRSGDRHDAAH